VLEPLSKLEDVSYEEQVMSLKTSMKYQNDNPLNKYVDDINYFVLRYIILEVNQYLKHVF
jgi:hypothetical protein